MGRLRYGGDEVSLTRLDRSYIGTAAAALEQERDLALIYPSAPTYLQLPVLLAVGYQTRSIPPALFISNRSGAGIREQYFGVGIGERVPDAPVRSLAEFTAPLVKTGDGRGLSYITHHKPRDWEGGIEGVSIVHSTLGRKIAADFPDASELPLSAIVLDLTTKLLNDFNVIRQYQEHAAERDIPLLYIFDTPCHRHLGALEEQNEDRPPSEQTLFWGLSPATLSAAGRGVLDAAASNSEFDPHSVTAANRDQNSPFENSLPVIRNIINGVDRDITELTYGDLQPVATDAYRKIQKVASYVHHRRDTFPRAVSQTMRDLHFTHSYLSTLPTSVEFHDDIMAFESGWGAGSALDQMIDNVRGNYHELESDVTGAGNMLEDACDALSRMRSQLVQRNPKADEIVSELRAALEADESLVVLTATNRQTSLLRSFVSEQAGLGGTALDAAGIEFHPLYNTHTIPMGDRLLFPGVPSKSHHPAVLSGAAPDQTYLSYSWESDRLRYWLDELQRVANHRCGPGALVYTADQLDVNDSGLESYLELPETGHQPVPAEREGRDGDDGTTDEEAEVPTTRKQGVGSQSATSVGTSDSAVEADAEIDPESFAPDPGALRNAAESFDDGTEQESVYEGREEVSSTGSGTVLVVRIDLSGNACLFERPGGLVWVYADGGSGQKRRRRKAAKALEQGDMILITEQESRRDIFEHIVEKIRSEVPEFKNYSKMLEYWRTNLERIVSEQDVTAKHISTALEEYSSRDGNPDVTRTYHAVRDWINKETIGPSEYRVIEALGEIYDVDIYRELAKEIEASLDEIRSLHRQVGKQLDKILFSAGSADDSDAWLFERFGIRVGDVQDAIEYRTVESVSEDTVEISRRELGRLSERR